MSMQLSTWNAHSIQGNCGNSACWSEIILQENKGPRAQAIHLYEIVFSTNLQVWTWLVPFWFTPLTWEHKFMYYFMFVITVLYVACVTKYGVSNGSDWIVKSNCEIKIDLREHRQAMNNGDLGSSALAECVFSFNHRVDLYKAMVIDTHNHTQTRCLLKLWHIQHHQSPLNREGYFARTLCCTIDLTIHPSGVLPLLCYYYYYSFSFFP